MPIAAALSRAETGWSTNRVGHLNYRPRQGLPYSVERWAVRMAGTRSPPSSTKCSEASSGASLVCRPGQSGLFWPFLGGTEPPRELCWSSLANLVKFRMRGPPGAVVRIPSAPSPATTCGSPNPGPGTSSGTCRRP
ncbi:hypothetical protein VTH06DRAFT_3781 [Thermothelomyces fergusii]